MMAEHLQKISHKTHSALRSRFLSLRNRNFKLFFIGQSISNTGNWLTNVALVLLVLSITGSGFAVGLLAAFQYGPILLLSAWGGAIADRMDKHRALFWTQGLEMLQSICLAVVAFTPHPSLIALYILAACGGVLLAFDNPLRRSFIAEMVRSEDLTNATVLNTVMVNASRLVGPALAGVLVISFGYGWAFTVDALSYIAVITCLSMMRTSELFRVPPKSRQKGEIRAGFRYVLTTPNLWISFAMLAAIGTLSYNFNVTLPLFVTDTLHGTNTEFTILYSIFSAGAVLSSIWIADCNFVGIRHIIWGAGALGASMLLFAATSSLSSAAIVVFFLGIASVLYMTSSTAMVQLETKADMRGRVLALQMVLVMGTTPIGGPLLGYLADIAGGRVPIFLGGIVCLIAAAFGHVATRRVEMR